MKYFEDLNYDTMSKADAVYILQHMDEYTSQYCPNCIKDLMRVRLAQLIKGDKYLVDIVHNIKQYHKLFLDFEEHAYDAGNTGAILCKINELLGTNFELLVTALESKVRDHNVNKARWKLFMDELNKLCVDDAKCVLEHAMACGDFEGGYTLNHHVIEYKPGEGWIHTVCNFETDEFIKQ